MTRSIDKLICRCPAGCTCTDPEEAGVCRHSVVGTSTATTGSDSVRTESHGPGDASGPADAPPTNAGPHLPPTTLYFDEAHRLPEKMWSGWDPATIESDRVSIFRWSDDDHLARWKSDPVSEAEFAQEYLLSPDATARFPLTKKARG